MTGLDISCVSQYSTAVYLSTVDHQPSSSSSTIAQLGGRAIDRHNPIIADSRRTARSPALPTPCTSSMPISPVPYHHLYSSKERESFSYSSKSKKEKHHKKRSSSSSKPSPSGVPTRSFSCSSRSVKKSDAKPKSDDLKSPTGSSRYLLSEAYYIEGFSHTYDNTVSKKLVACDQTGSKAGANWKDQSSATPKPESTAVFGSKSHPDQVVVLRVSLHCRGCEGKVRKHLSKMEGVTSFKIDFAAKKVTIIGNVTPHSVLASVSKVKNAQFWNSPTTHNKKQ